MPTIELETQKAVVRFDLAEAPRQAFIEFQGNYYAGEDGGRLLWKPIEGTPPKQASIVRLSIDGTLEVLTDAPPAPTPPPSSPPEATHDAEPDHAGTV